MVDPPLIDATGLTLAQREGHACLSCRKRLPRPTIPVGRMATGQVLYRCPECWATLEPVDPGLRSMLSGHTDHERRG